MSTLSATWARTVAPVDVYDFAGQGVPVLLDIQQELTRQLKATVTPEAILLTAKGEAFYQGRIDDLYLGPTKRQRSATTRDLRDAISALLAGTPAPQLKHAAQGCKIGGIK